MFYYKNFKLIGALTSKPYAFTARSWELERIDFIDFYDPMLSSVALDLRGFSIMRILPRINEILNEEWISDKVRFSYDGFRRQRLVTPLYKENLLTNYQEITWEESFFLFYFIYNLNNYDWLNNGTLETVLGPFLDVESLVILKDVLLSFFDSKSIIRHQNLSFYDNYLSTDYLFNQKVSSLDKIDFCLCLGTNLRFENPILNLKILRAVNNGLVVFSLFCLSNLKYKTYSFGNQIKKLFSFLEGKNPYSMVLSKSKMPLIILGDSLRQRADSRQIIRMFNYRHNFSFFISTLSKDLSQIICNEIGFPGIKNLKVEKSILYLYGCDDLLIKRDKYNFIVYQGHHGDYGASMANLIYPSTFLIEKKGSFLNLEGNVSHFRFILRPGINIRTDWRIFRALSMYMKLNLNVIVDSFKDVMLRCCELMSNYNSNNIKNNIFIEKVRGLISFQTYRLNNNLLFSIYINYYLSDVISRSSKIMSITALRFKNYFINF